MRFAIAKLGHLNKTGAALLSAILSVAALDSQAASQERLPLNPAVTQWTIGETICVPRWTKTVRPPVSLTNRLKIELIRREGLPEELLVDFELDHRIPLCLGGAPADPKNFQLEDWDEAGKKDRVEACLARAVCSGRITLPEAQRRIWLNWRRVGVGCDRSN